jgi:hypothetical protein
MEQAIKVLNASKSVFRHRRHKSGGKEGEKEETEEESKPAPTSLFPLPELLEQLLRQEAELWKKNKGLVQVNIRGEHTLTAIAGGSVSNTPVLAFPM